MSNLIDELMVDKSSNQLIPSIKEVEKPVSIKEIDFVEYWRRQGQESSYSRGQLIGATINDNAVLFEEFLKKLSKSLEEYTRLSLSKNGGTSEEFQPTFKALFFFLNSFINHIKNKNVKFDNDEFVAFYHGFFNSFFNKFIK